MLLKLTGCGHFCFLARRLHINSESCFDFAIVGGGIIGVSTARLLSLKNPGAKIVILEKESKLAQHQTGKNSGVIHSGIYYPPGSLKAKLCTEGAKKIYDYLEERDIPYKKIGKLVIAVEHNEIFRLEKLYERAKINKVPGVELVDEKDIPEFQVNCRGLKALWSPTTGIVDWAVVTRSFADDFVTNGGQIKFDFEVTNLEFISGQTCSIKLKDKKGLSKVQASFVLTAAGLFSDRLARLTGCSKDPMIIPFRGEYLLLRPAKEGTITTHIYPVPDPRLPFLGVHFSPRIDGSLLVGPNALLACKREGYSYKDINLKDLFETLTYPGFIKLSSKFFKNGIEEIYRSLNLKAQVKYLKKYFPDLEVNDFEPGPSGVRAQALSRGGELVEDFVFDYGKEEYFKNILHVRNAPSPGATSSIAIGEAIVNQIAKNN